MNDRRREREDDDEGGGEVKRARLEEEGTGGVRFVCRLCAGPFQDPVSLLCGHNFCMVCLNEHFHRSLDRRLTIDCPECRARCKFADSRLQVNVVLGILSGAITTTPPPPPPPGEPPRARGLDDYRTGGVGGFPPRGLYTAFVVDASDVEALRARIEWLRFRLARMRERAGFCAGMRRVGREVAAAVAAAGGGGADAEALWAAHVDAMSLPEKTLALFGSYLDRLAARAFRVGQPGGLRHALYDVLLVDVPWRTTPADSEAMQRLRELPLRGIAAENSLLIVPCPSRHLPRALAFIADMGFEYQTMLAELHYCDSRGAARQPKPFARHEITHFLVGVLGTAPFLTEANHKNQTMVVRHRHVDTYPSLFWVELHKLLKYPGKYKHRVKLFNPQRVVGWENFEGGAPPHTPLEAADVDEK